MPGGAEGQDGEHDAGGEADRVLRSPGGEASHQPPPTREARMDTMSGARTASA
jgi:hypothetical protein